MKKYLFIASIFIICLLLLGDNYKFKKNNINLILSTKIQLETSEIKKNIEGKFKEKGYRARIILIEKDSEVNKFIIKLETTLEEEEVLNLLKDEIWVHRIMINYEVKIN